MSEQVVQQNSQDVEEDEKAWSPRFCPGEHEAYCKYCYQTHGKWEYWEDFWVCGHCNAGVADENMQIVGVPPSPWQMHFFRQHGGVYCGELYLPEEDAHVI